MDMQNVLYCKSLKSKLSDNNCAIAMFTNILKIKVQPNKLREQLGIELNTYINVNQLDLLVDYFKCDILLYVLKDTFEIVKNTNRYDKKFEAYLEDNHYYIVIKHSLKKDYGICEECGQERNNNGHKCDLEVIRRNKMKIVEQNINSTWNEQYNLIFENMRNNKNIIQLGSWGVGKS